MKRWAATMLAIVVVSGGVAPARAATQLAGEYDWMMELRKDLRAFPWDFNSNDPGIYSPLELRLFSQPGAGMDAFFKVAAEFDESNNPSFRPELQYREAHLHFRREFGARGMESYLFSRQDRFWSDTYLISYVSSRGDAQGARFDSWGFLGAKATFIVADQSSAADPYALAHSGPYTYNPITNPTGTFPPALAPVDSLARQGSLRTNDIYVARLRRELFADKRLRLGMTYDRYESWTGTDSLAGPGKWNSILGFDSRYRVGGTDVSLEYGQSFSGAGRTGTMPFTLFKDPTGIQLPDRAVMQAEIRSIKLGSVRTGYLGITPGWWQRGASWTNSLGGPNSDETGFNVQSYYLVPQRALTYSNQLLWFGNKVFSRNSVREIYNELYVEFVNGFTGKTYYRRRDEYSFVNGRPTRATHLTWFNELQVESRLAWLRFESKSQDIGRADHKALFAIETRLNLTDKTKVYNRFALGNDPATLRKGVFSQLQYRPTGNMEMDLQYGPDNIGSASTPVDDGNLAGSGDQYDVIKFILKGSF